MKWRLCQLLPRVAAHRGEQILESGFALRVFAAVLAQAGFHDFARSELVARVAGGVGGSEDDGGSGEGQRAGGNAEAGHDAGIMPCDEGCSQEAQGLCGFLALFVKVRRLWK